MQVSLEKIRKEIEMLGFPTQHGNNKFLNFVITYERWEEFWEKLKKKN